MNQPAKAQEPSMEEILASIRRIIADDDASKTAKPAEPAAPKAPPVAAVPARPAPPPPPRAPAAPPRPAPPAVANSQEDIDAMLADIEQNGGGSAPEVLDLTESMAASTPSPASFRTIDGQSDVVFSDRAAAPPPPPPQPEPAPRYDEPRAATPMPDHGLLSNSATNAVDNAFNSLAHTVLAQNARTLDDIVREMLRPMLKAWLDDNLPGMVERIVRAEIERVSRGRP